VPKVLLQLDLMNAFKPHSSKRLQLNKLCMKFSYVIIDKYFQKFEEKTPRIKLQARQRNLK